MSIEGLHERLTALQETASQAKELIDRLANLKFQPGSVPLRTDEENTVSAELSSEISQILREEEDELEILQEEVEDVRAGRSGSEMAHQKTRLKDGMERLGKELSSLRSQFCKAQLSARRNLAEAQRLERELLLKSYSEPVSLENSMTEDATPGTNGSAPAPAPYPGFRRQQHSALSEEDQQMVNASSEVTRGMLRLRDNIERALTRSHATYETLEESSLALGQVGESYMSLDSMLASSRELLGTLLRSQKSDTWYLQNSFYMLLGVLVWLVVRRFLYGPMWLIWLPVKLGFYTAVGVGNAVSKWGGQSSPADGTVGEEAKVSVEGIPDESLPTAKVGQEEKPASAGDEPGSMAEKVGKIIDDNDNDNDETTDRREGEASVAEGKPVEVGSGEKDEL